MIGVALIVSSILLLKVVPQFQSLFAGFNAELPWLTQKVIGLSYFLQQHGGTSLAACLGLGLGGRLLYRRSARLRDHLDAGLLRLPLGGALLHKSAVARMARTLATTFAAGVPWFKPWSPSLVPAATTFIDARWSVSASRSKVACN